MDLVVGVEARFGRNLGHLVNAVHAGKIPPIAPIARRVRVHLRIRHWRGGTTHFQPLHDALHARVHVPEHHAHSLLRGNGAHHFVRGEIQNHQLVLQRHAEQVVVRQNGAGKNGGPNPVRRDGLERVLHMARFVQLGLFVTYVPKPHGHRPHAHAIVLALHELKFVPVSVPRAADIILHVFGLRLEIPASLAHFQR